MFEPELEIIPVPKHIVALNVSSVLLQTYPDTSPWDQDNVGLETLEPPHLQPTSFPFDNQLKGPALAQAVQTGVNPFYFISTSNPFLLDNPGLERVDLPLKSYQEPHFLPYSHIPSSVISDFEEIYAGDHQCMYRAKLDGEPRVFKLFLESEQPAVGDDNSSRFDRESNAYRHLAHYGACESGAVPKCFGWFMLSLDNLQPCEPHSVSSPPGSPIVASLVITMHSASGHCWKGLILEDLTGFVPVSIHNVSGPIAQNALKALHKVHSAFVQHGDIARRHIILLPETDRVIWVGFDCSFCGKGSVSRQSLFHELAQTWSFLYEKLIPDAFIGFDNDGAGTDVWKRRMVASSSKQSSGSGSLQRVPKPTIEAEVEAIISAYPEKNVLDWVPQIHNMIPEPKDDHRHDTAEFLSAIKQSMKKGRMIDNPFIKWYGACPIVLRDNTRFAQLETTFEEYQAPASLPQIPSDSPMEVLECLRETGPHPLVRVRLGGEERLLKVYSGGWWDPEIAKYGDISMLNFKLSKQFFEIEKSAYAHLVRYGACHSGAVPMCYGWMEMSELNIAGANTAIASSIKDYSPSGWRYRPPFVDPIFADGSPAAALVLEYIPNAEVLETRNLTHPLAASAMRALSRIHGAYVLHGDFLESKNVLIAKGDPDRVVIVDFDHATDVSSGAIQRGAFREELHKFWIMLYCGMFPDQRRDCALPHPHDV